MKKKLLIATMVFALVMALVGGATFALFTDSDSNKANTFSAGTVEINADRNSGEPTPGPMFYSFKADGIAPGYTQNPKKATGEWYPGKSEDRDLTVTNIGTLPCRIAYLGAEITGDSNFIADAAAMAELASQMQVVITNGEPAHVAYEGPLSGLLKTGGAKVDKLMEKDGEGNWGEVFRLDPDSNMQLHYTCTLSTYAGNALQGKKPVISFYQVVEQTDNN